ncbi:hypothetical protein BDV25DRAFT_148322 [Aspergillus avenaceus]|uniref:Uncharacterized protein n=1 Tax=Aspergillus avenaceus TaxID=36643 RepID=A0A5N6U677_ASPAV|nr:hypothetical protein BDV25DRAFT_148322 [Aspergillus avenaceus]
MLKKIKILQRIQDMIESFNGRQSIPSDYESILEEHLVLVCKPPERLEWKPRNIWAMKSTNKTS